MHLLAVSLSRPQPLARSTVPQYLGCLSPSPFHRLAPFLFPSRSLARAKVEPNREGYALIVHGLRGAEFRPGKVTGAAMRSSWRVTSRLFAGGTRLAPSTARRHFPSYYGYEEQAGRQAAAAAATDGSRKRCVTHRARRRGGTGGAGEGRPALPLNGVTLPTRRRASPVRTRRRRPAREIRDNRRGFLLVARDCVERSCLTRTRLPIRVKSLACTPRYLGAQARSKAACDAGAWIAAGGGGVRERSLGQIFISSNL